MGRRTTADDPRRGAGAAGLTSAGVPRLVARRIIAPPISPASNQYEELATGLPNGWHGMVNTDYRRGQYRFTESVIRQPQQPGRHLPTAGGGVFFDLCRGGWRHVLTSTRPRRRRPRNRARRPRASPRQKRVD